MAWRPRNCVQQQGPPTDQWRLMARGHVRGTALTLRLLVDFVERTTGRWFVGGVPIKTQSPIRENSKTGKHEFCLRGEIDQTVAQTSANEIRGGRTIERLGISLGTSALGVTGDHAISLQRPALQSSSQQGQMGTIAAPWRYDRPSVSTTSRAGGSYGSSQVLRLDQASARFVARRASLGGGLRRSAGPQKRARGTDRVAAGRAGTSARSWRVPDRRRRRRRRRQQPDQPRRGCCRSRNSAGSWQAA